MKRPLLWKVSGPGIEPSIVLGTMHVKSQKAFDRLSEIENLIQSCTCFMAEYHLDEVRFSQSPEDLLIGQGKSLRQLIGDKKFSKWRKIIQKAFGLDLEQFEYYLPLLIVNIVSEAILSNEFPLPLDVHLWAFAKQSGKALRGAETYASQVKILKNIKIGDQVKMLKMICKNPAFFRRKILRMADWYEEEQIHLIYKYGKKSLGKYKNLLLTRRNYKMMQSFLNSAAEMSTFMAVGAGHLGGQQGILKMLKQKGYRLEAIKKHKNNE